jgi:ACS family glucarate transporter-like MFS transporter
MAAPVEPTRTPTGRFRWMLMAFIIFPLTFVMSLDRTNMAVSAPVIQQHFHFSLVDMSLILTSFAWTYAVFQIPGGLLTERLGSRRMLTFADIWWSIWTAATTLGYSVASFIGIRGLLGVGQAADWSASVNSIKRWFPAHERARAHSILLGGLVPGSHHRHTAHGGNCPGARVAVVLLHLRRRRHSGGLAVVALLS